MSRSLGLRYGDEPVGAVCQDEHDAGGGRVGLGGGGRAAAVPVGRPVPLAAVRRAVGDRVAGAALQRRRTVTVDALEWGVHVSEGRGHVK